MLQSVLLHFGGSRQGQELIDMGVRLARGASARVRGLTLVDTRRIASVSATSESAAYAHHECGRVRRVEAAHEGVRVQLSQACLTAGVDFDLRRLRGNPCEILPHEAQFHDLIITTFPAPGDADEESPGLSAAELVELLFQGVQPLLVLRRPERALGRVLLATDGTPASAAAVRQFLQQRIAPEAELRLLAIGETEAQATTALREMSDYARGLRRTFESGWLCGTPRRHLVPYAQKWNADLVVWGVPRDNRVIRRLLGGPAETILRATDMALYATA